MFFQFFIFRQMNQTFAVNSFRDILKANENMENDTITNIESGPQNLEKEKIFKRCGEEREKELSEILTTEASEAIDLVPFVGDGKKIFESVLGTTSDGKELNGKERIIQAAVSVSSIVFFFTPPGTVMTARNLAVLAGKSPVLIGKIAEDLREKGHDRSAEIFARTKSFMERYAETVKETEKDVTASFLEGFENLKKSVSEAFEDEGAGDK